jgi:hypothetical protein
VHAKDDWTVGRAFIDVVDTERPTVAVGNIGVTRLVGEVRKVAKALVWGS